METMITFTLGLISGALSLGIFFNIRTLIRLNREVGSLQKSSKGQQSDCDQRFATRDQRVKDAHAELRSELNRIHDQLAQTNTLVYTIRSRASDEIIQLRDEIKKELAGMDNSDITSRISALEEDSASTRNELGREMSDLEARIDDLESNLEDANDTIRLLESQIDELNEDLEATIEDTVDALSTRMDSLFSEVGNKKGTAAYPKLNS